MVPEEDHKLLNHIRKMEARKDKKKDKQKKDGNAAAAKKDKTKGCLKPLTYSLIIHMRISAPMLPLCILQHAHTHTYAHVYSEQ